MKRILGALLFAPIAVILVYFSTPFIFFLAVSAVVIICLLEFYRLIKERGTAANSSMGIILGFLVVLSYYYGRPSFMTFVISAGTMALFIITIAKKSGVQSGLENAAYTLVGVFFVAWLLAHLVLLHGMEDGRFYILFLLIVVWLSDTAAYYVGKNAGRHKLAPEISPGKTVEGAAAGLGGAILGAFIAKWWFLRQFSAGEVFFLGVLLGVMGQLGDLSESVIKRSAGAKDSGNLIPGHGGLLDRLDSLLFSAPVLYYYVLTLTRF